MRNIAYILAFLLVCPTLLFATQTDDNAAVLKRLDDIINPLVGGHGSLHGSACAARTMELCGWQRDRAGGAVP